MRLTARTWGEDGPPSGQVRRLRPDRLGGTYLRRSDCTQGPCAQSAVPLSLGLVGDERLARNPAHKARLPRLERREAMYWDPGSVDRLIGAVPTQFAGFIAVQGVIGLRFGEAAALRRGSVNGLRKELRLQESLAEIGGRLVFGPTKSHAQRTVPLPPSVSALLEARLEQIPSEPDALLFTSARGLPLRYSRFRPQVWRPALEKVGVPAAGMHTLRHSAAARMIHAGWPPVAVQQVLGHRSAAFTLTVYGHLFSEDLAELAAALDLSGGTSAVRTIAAGVNLKDQTEV